MLLCGLLNPSTSVNVVVIETTHGGSPTDETGIEMMGNSATNLLPPSTSNMSMVSLESISLERAKLVVQPLVYENRQLVAGFEKLFVNSAISALFPHPG